MSDVLTILSILSTILIPLFIWLWRKYYLRPELTIELEPYRQQSCPEGFSSNNIAVDGVIEMRAALQIFRLSWTFFLKIRNNSEHNAYYPNLYLRENGILFTAVEDINPQDAIGSGENISLKLCYEEQEECVGEKRTSIGRFPSSAFDNLEILISYRNFAKHNFYSLYKHNSKTTSFLIRKPKGFLKYN